MIESKSFDYENNVIAFMVITKKKWTDAERMFEANFWGAYYESPIKAILYNKNDEPTAQFCGPFNTRSRTSPSGNGGISRVATKLTEKQMEEGLLRFRIKIDLDTYGEGAVGNAVSAKFVYPEVKP